MTIVSIKTQIALLEQEQKFTNEKLDRIETKLDSMFDIFATKEELGRNEKRIEELEKDKKGAIIGMLKWI